MEDSSNGNEKEARIKGVRGISLRACVAKAAGWTLEKANFATSQEATTSKQSDSKWFEHIGMWKEHFKLHELHVIIKTITRTRTLKDGGFGLTVTSPISSPQVNPRKYARGCSSQTTLSATTTPPLNWSPVISPFRWWQLSSLLWCSNLPGRAVVSFCYHLKTTNPWKQVTKKTKLVFIGVNVTLD